MFTLVIIVSILGCSCSTKFPPVVTNGQENSDRSCPLNVDLIRENVTKTVRRLLQPVYRDCKAVFDAGQVTSEVYTVSPNNSNPFEVSEQLSIIIIIMVDNGDHVFIFCV